MTNIIYIVGPAGSGKSTLTLSLLETMESYELKCVTVNLDPGAEWLPYTPDIDIRKDISLTEIMRRYKLGPNGGLIAAIDLLVDHVHRLREIIKGMKPDYVLVDTPGQMELFAFRDSGPIVVKTLGENRGTLFLADACMCRSPSTFVSTLLLSASVFVRFRNPQIIALTKTDLIKEDDLNRILDWWDNQESLLDAMQEEPNPLQRDVASSILPGLRGLGMPGELIPVSATRGSGMLELMTSIERAFASETALDLGKEFEPP